MIPILKLRMMKLRDDIKMIGLMTALTLIMIAVFSSVNYSQSTVTFGYIDEDQSSYSQQVLERLKNQEEYSFVEYSLEEAKEAVKKDDISGAFYIKQGFEENVKNGSVSIEKLIVTENMSNLQMDALFSSVVNEVHADEMVIGVVQMIVPNETVPDYMREAFQEHRTYKQPMNVETFTVTEENSYDSVKHSVIGFSLFFAMFTIVFGISDILMDKEYHTWGRLMVSPISKFSVIGGNILTILIMGFVQVSSMFLVSKYLFRVDWAGNMLHLMIVLAAFVFCVTSLGMFLSNFVNTMGQLSAISPVIITGSAMIGGCFWPLEIVTSRPLLLLSNIAPQKWAISAIKSIVVNGYGLNEVYVSLLVLVGMGIAYMLLGTYLLEKKSA